MAGPPKAGGVAPPPRQGLDALCDADRTLVVDLVGIFLAAAAAAVPDPAPRQPETADPHGEAA